MTAILCGYNWIGCNILDQLLERFEKVFVYTHQSPEHLNDLEAYCKKINIPYSLNKISEENIPFVPDVIVSAYYRYIIGSKVIDLVNGKIFNIHPSLLPQYRGCSSITWAIINNEEHAGYSYHYIDPGVDTGNIILQKQVKILGYDTQASLYQRIMFEAAKDFTPALDSVLNNAIGSEQQSNGNAKYYTRGCPYKGEINPDWDDATKERFIRAMIHPPLPPATLLGRPIWKFEEINNNYTEQTKK